jgi:hypothetical protein
VLFWIKDIFVWIFIICLFAIYVNNPILFITFDEQNPSISLFDPATADQQRIRGKSGESGLKINVDTVRIF